MREMYISLTAQACCMRVDTNGHSSPRVFGSLPYRYDPSLLPLPLTFILHTVTGVPTRLRLPPPQAMVKVAGVMEKSSAVMGAMQDLVRIPEIQATMMQLSKEMMKVGCSVSSRPPVLQPLLLLFVGCAVSVAL